MISHLSESISCGCVAPLEMSEVGLQLMCDFVSDRVWIVWANPSKAGNVYDRISQTASVIPCYLLLQGGSCFFCSSKNKAPKTFIQVYI